MSYITRVLLLISAVAWTNGVFGQSISVVRGADNKYSVQAIAPAGEAFTLQSSENLHLWIDITNDVSAQYSAPLGGGDFPTRFYRLIPTPPEPEAIRVALLGDSMVSDCCGWGQGMYGFFNDKALVLNYSQPWTSTKVFLQSAEYDKMMLVKPQYVLMQFGYSDGGIGDPDRYSNAEEFTANLRTLAQTIRGFNGIPIFITLHANRYWDAQGNLIPSDHGYNIINKQVAAEFNAPLIDLYRSSFDLFTKLGREGCAFMHWQYGSPEDGLHFSPEGAVYASQLIVRALPDELGPYLTRVFDPLPRP
jgi:lysophospholipase L1-like esterase